MRKLFKYANIQIIENLRNGKFINFCKLKINIQFRWKSENYSYPENGFTLIELVIAIGLAALFIPALVFVLSFSLSSASQGESYTKAYSLAQEQMEIIYHLKDQNASWDWEFYPENNSTSDYYQPVKIEGEWNLGPKFITPAEKEGYVVTVQIFPVERIAGSIDEETSGTLDPTTRKVVANVKWSEKGQPANVELVSYISKH